MFISGLCVIIYHTFLHKDVLLPSWFHAHAHEHDDMLDTNYCLTHPQKTHTLHNLADIGELCDQFLCSGEVLDSYT